MTILFHHRLLLLYFYPMQNFLEKMHFSYSQLAITRTFNCARLKLAEYTGTSDLVYTYFFQLGTIGESGQIIIGFVNMPCINADMNGQFIIRYGVGTLSYSFICVQNPTGIQEGNKCRSYTQEGEGTFILEVGSLFRIFFLIEIIVLLHMY